MWILNYLIKITFLHPLTILSGITILQISLERRTKCPNTKALKMQSLYLIHLQYVGNTKMKILWGKLFNKRFDIFRSKK